jgi:hypothetical protein
MTLFHYLSSQCMQSVDSRVYVFKRVGQVHFTAAGLSAGRVTYVPVIFCHLYA